MSILAYHNTEAVIGQIAMAVNSFFKPPKINAMLCVTFIIALGKTRSKKANEILIWILENIMIDIDNEINGYYLVESLSNAIANCTIDCNSEILYSFIKEKENTAKKIIALKAFNILGSRNPTFLMKIEKLFYELLLNFKTKKLKESNRKWHIRILDEVIIALGIIKNEKALKFLGELINHSNPFIRDEAVKALSNFGKLSLPYLTFALNDPDECVRMDAAAYLGIIGSPESIEPLKALLKDSNLLARNNARLALNKN